MALQRDELGCPQMLCLSCPCHCAKASSHFSWFFIDFTWQHGVGVDGSRALCGRNSHYLVKGTGGPAGFTAPVTSRVMKDYTWICIKAELSATCIKSRGWILYNVTGLSAFRLQGKGPLLLNGHWLAQYISCLWSVSPLHSLHDFPSLVLVSARLDSAL